jgi:metal-sulfur cluster biosynthetic enzyme
VDGGSGRVNIRLTLTAPGCPVAQSFPAQVAGVVGAVPGVSDVDVALVWDPPWSQEMMSEAARLQLGLL